MIVIDASIVGPIVLLDEVPLPPPIAAALGSDRLVAPAHWTIKIANLLLVAYRRGRFDAIGSDMSYNVIADLRVEVASAPTIEACRAIATLAEQERLTAYDAAYLHLALVRSAAIATLDGALTRAADRRGIEVLTFR